MDISKYRSNASIAVNECGVISDHLVEETIRIGPGMVIIISIISICTNNIMFLDTDSVAYCIASPCKYMYTCRLPVLVMQYISAAEKGGPSLGRRLVTCQPKQCP